MTKFFFFQNLVLEIVIIYSRRQLANAEENKIWIPMFFIIHGEALPPYTKQTSTVKYHHSLCYRPLRSAGSPWLCLPQLAARACHHSIQILGDNPRAQKPPLWPLQKYSRLIHMCTRYLAHTQSGRNGHSTHPNEAHIFLKRGSQRSPHHGRYKMG